MSLERELAEEERDQAIRDLIALDEQIRAGEVPPGPAQLLRSEYERAAADALARLDSLPAQPSGSRRARRGARTRALAYLGTVLLAAVAALVILPDSVQQRPQNGFVTGNEVMQSTSGMPMPMPSAAPSLPADADAAATALWIQANVELFQRNDPEAALRTLDQLQQRPDLSASARQDVAALVDTARRELRKAGR
ncbi:hypothetical protein ABZ215_36915 [Amycolatopsis sp. NPDC006131]|uniref:hypothetical protein n=1 Tax=Amycolatopsis sp. NPDC006131 TaxID=3156731 RepID=UPI0033A0503D